MTVINWVAELQKEHETLVKFNRDVVKELNEITEEFTENTGISTYIKTIKKGELWAVAIGNKKIEINESDIPITSVDTLKQILINIILKNYN